MDLIIENLLDRKFELREKISFNNQCVRKYQQDIEIIKSKIEREKEEIKEINQLLDELYNLKKDLQSKKL